MGFTLELTDEQTALREKTHAFARDVIRPVATEYDRRQEHWMAAQRHPFENAEGSMSKLKASEVGHAWAASQPPRPAPPGQHF